tara:strand:+ start:5997 stop:8030 length:2034 start_codon:yes stop_codon:yes gene_type:complete
MDKNLIKKRYRDKIKSLNYFNKKYFDENISEITDTTFDKLKKEIIELENKYNFLKSANSPLFTVGFKPSKNFKKISHRKPMLSLANAFNEDDLINFEKKVFNFLGKEKDQFKIEYSAEPKIDGISASLIYKNGKLVSGLSRGDGKQGEDITANLKTIDDIPKTILSEDFPSEIDIRGEVFIKKSDFERLKEKFANPRNAASGSLRQKNPEDTKKIPLKFIAYTFGFQKGIKINTQYEFLKKLSEWGFKTNPFNKLITGIKDLIVNYNSIENKRGDIDFDIDGVVYKINDLKIQDRLGSVANAPRWAIAHKFSANSGFSKIIDIDVQIGRTGALTPVAKINPVNVGGVIVSNATLHNEDEIIRKDIRVGDTVVVERAGDVIPHIKSIVLKKRLNNSKKFVFPNKCPSCGSLTVKEFNLTTRKKDVVRRCSSEGFECNKVAEEKIKHFVSKEALNIEGFGKKIVENFCKLKLIKLPQDIFNLDFNKIEEMDGWGKQSISNLKYFIESSKNTSFDKFIYALGIRHIGLENAKLISKHLVSPKNFFNLSTNDQINELLIIDGIGETQIESIKNFFSNKTNLEVLGKLKKILKIKDNIPLKNNGFLTNKTFLITGKLKGISRAETKSLIEQNSGSIVSSVSKKLNYLLVGDKPTKRKVDLAKELNIKIINQKELLKMLDKTS